MEMKILEALNFYLVFLSESFAYLWLRDLPNQLDTHYAFDGPHPLSLIHPPYLITLACIYIASVYKEKDIRTWFEELYVGMNIASFQNCTFDHKGLFCHEITSCCTYTLVSVQACLDYAQCKVVAN
ncbi:hypothetical protein YC2023_025542 [Brassica napus]